LEEGFNSKFAMWRPSVSTVVRSSERVALTKSRLLSSSVSKESQSLAQEHARFLQDVAKVEVPSRLPALVETLKLQGLELVEPQKRHSLNPFFIPVGKDATTGHYVGFMRWPTQKEGMDLQIATTTEAGVKLVALSTDKYVARMAAESDFYGRPESDYLESMANESGTLYKKGDSLAMLNSGRFPSQTDHDKRLILDRYLLTKVGAFPEGYERLAEDFREKKNDVSALVTCERSSNVFYGWGHPNTYHALMLLKLNRAAEAKDTAQSSLAMPKWTLTSTIKVGSFVYSLL
jgi:hypothetical protein